MILNKMADFCGVSVGNIGILVHTGGGPCSVMATTPDSHAGGQIPVPPHQLWSPSPLYPASRSQRCVKGPERDGVRKSRAPVMTKKTCTYLQVLEIERGERVLVVVVPSPGLPRFERGYQQGLDLLYDQRGAFKVAGEVAGALWGE